MPVRSCAASGSEVDRACSRRELPRSLPLRRKMLCATLAVSFAISGCVTSLGYYQDNLKAKQVKNSPNWVPPYEVVKHWAYDVNDAFDARATANHYALEYGALFGLAAAGTIAGLAIFNPASPALKGIPVGAAFLTGAAAYYDNHFR